MIEIRRYVSATGRDEFGSWMASLKDIKAKAVINARIARVAVGNFGDCKFLAKGVYELRIRFGAGYRVYFGKHGSRIVLLLCGGDKSTQKRDITKAIELFADYKQRENL